MAVRNAPKVVGCSLRSSLLSSRTPLQFRSRLPRKRDVDYQWRLARDESMEEKIGSPFLSKGAGSGCNSPVSEKKSFYVPALEAAQGPSRVRNSFPHDTMTLEGRAQGQKRSILV